MKINSDYGVSVIDDSVGNCIREKFQPLYEALDNYKSLLMKMSILEELDLDDNQLIKKTINKIDEEMDSLSNISDWVDLRVTKVFKQDANIGNKFKDYRDDLEEYIHDLGIKVVDET